MLLAGDVGGTRTRLGLFERAPRRPLPLAIRTYPTSDFASFRALLDVFMTDVHAHANGAPVEAAVAGVAGPVVLGTSQLTNIDWTVSAADMAAELGTPRVQVLNDLEAMAIGTGVLDPEEFVPLQAGIAREEGNAAVIAAGTGLGEAYLHRVNGRLHPVPSEGGHADFAARTDREIDLVRTLRHRYGRAEVEHVLSGPGLLNIHRFTHDDEACQVTGDLADIDAPANMTRAALDGRCPKCVEALSLFVDAYGAEAGNLALRGMATSGVFVGGGIAPQILPALQDGRFIKAFRAKGAMSALVAEMPVRVILMPDVGLFGAAVAAQELLGEPVIPDARVI